MNDVVLGIILQLKDEATAGLNNFSNALEKNRRLMHQASTYAIVLGAGLLAVALMAAKSADTSGRMAVALANMNAQLAKVRDGLAAGIIPIVVLFLNTMAGLLKLISMIPTPILAIVGAIILIGGSMLLTIGTILKFIIMIERLRAAYIALGIAQMIAKAFSGPVGWAQIGAGLAIAGAATGAIYGMAKLGSSGGGGSAASPVTINAQAFVGNRVEARKFAYNIQTIQREQTRVGR